MNKNIVFLEGSAIGNMNFELLKEFGNLYYYHETTEEQLEDRIKDAHIILVNKLPLNEKTLKDTKNLELICEVATGYNNIDIDYAKSRGIGVTNVAGYSTDTVAQHTFALFFHLYNKLSYYDNYVKSGEYVNSPIFTNLGREFHDISGKTWGIIGLGAIGKRVATIAEAFGAKVVYYSTSGKNNSREYESVSLEELLKKSDVISIHAPLNEATLGLMNYDRLKQMKKEAVLINVGRGPIVVEEDLAKVIDEDLIGGAALDVFKVEPMREDNPLLKVKNAEKLVLTPHVAWASVEARTRLFNEVIENIRAFYNGQNRNRIV